MWHVCARSAMGSYRLDHMIHLRSCLTSLIHPIQAVAVRLLVGMKRKTTPSVKWLLLLLKKTLPLQFHPLHHQMVLLLLLLITLGMEIHLENLPESFQFHWEENLHWERSTVLKRWPKCRGHLVRCHQFYELVKPGMELTSSEYQNGATSHHPTIISSNHRQQSPVNHNI